MCDELEIYFFHPSFNICIWRSLNMKDVITLGEAIIAFEPWTLGPMEHAHTFERKVGGAELNFAIGCSRLGLQAGWISHLGNDPFGLMIRNFIRGEGVDVSQVKFIDDYNTSIYFKEMFDSGDVHAYYYRDRSPVSVMKPTDLNESYFKRAKVLHLTGIFPAINPEKNMKIVHHAIKLAKKHDVKVSFDPNIRLKMWSKEEARRIIAEILPDVDILLASDDELEIILESKNPEQVFKKAEQLGISTVAMKRAENSTIGYD